VRKAEWVQFKREPALTGYSNREAVMSNQNDLTTLHHTLKDIERQLKKNSSQMGWILIFAVASFGLTLVSFIIIAAK